MSEPIEREWRFYLEQHVFIRQLMSYILRYAVEVTDRRSDLGEHSSRQH
ncbi:hypothetical protein B0F88_1222 [Methylobacter tundripaludum]|uniref:Uncharacterized protein n=1 Tax=Methylobacter tundripaludum TaxID=173365 RepID=A0A2S6GIR1_9GAMM|nr:hypothetical protein B0F88_1222 [Methylobacter tundripaludum]